MKFKTIYFTKENFTLKEVNKMEKALLEMQDMDFEEFNKMENVVEMLDSFVAMQEDEYGFFPLVVGRGMPGDCMYYYNRKPSYIILKLLMMSGNNKYAAPIQKCLEGCKKSKFMGHGYEAHAEQLKTTRMLLNAGILDYADDEMKDIISNIQGFAQRSLETGNTSFGFGTWEKEAKELVQETTPVFVYGSLLKGEYAHSLLESSEFVGNYVLPNYAMYDLGSYPGIKKENGESVIGELYLVDENTLEALYDYEGSMYQLNEVIVRNSKEKRKANVFVYKGNVYGNPIQYKWHQKEEDYVWYAAYGSNLNEERFKCYLQGGRCAENGRTYVGCTNKDLWKETEWKTIKGEVYFAKRSPSWNYKGVAFLKKGNNKVYTKLYKITFQQLLEIQKQEGISWYGKRVCLGIHNDGTPIYTYTNKEVLVQNKPDQAYLGLLKTTLLEHLKDEDKVNTYLKQLTK